MKEVLEEEEAEVLEVEVKLIYMHRFNSKRRQHLTDRITIAALSTMPPFV